MQNPKTLRLMNKAKTFIPPPDFQSMGSLTFTLLPLHFSTFH